MIDVEIHLLEKPGENKTERVAIVIHHSVPYYKNRFNCIFMLK